MGLNAIVLLIIGIVFFVVSFFLPDGKTEKENAVSEDIIKEMVNKEVQAAKVRIDDMVDETVNYSVEKSERQLEKISNEKIMAVDEYSETVLKKINDVHQETVFLYDMLNEKGEKLKNTDVVLQAKKEELKEKGRELEVKEEVLKARTEDLLVQREELKAEMKEKEESTTSFTPFIPEKIDLEKLLSHENTETVNTEEIKTPAGEKKTTGTKTRTVKKPVTGKTNKVVVPSKDSTKDEVDTPKVSEPQSVELHFDKDNESKKNSNEQIRKLHEEGKSNMAIAKELGLGVGEVKLVIDLFANKK